MHNFVLYVVCSSEYIIFYDGHWCALRKEPCLLPRKFVFEERIIFRPGYFYSFLFFSVLNMINTYMNESHMAREKIKHKNNLCGQNFYRQQTYLYDKIIYSRALCHVLIYNTQRACVRQREWKDKTYCRQLGSLTEGIFSSTVRNMFYEKCRVQTLCPNNDIDDRQKHRHLQDHLIEKNCLIKSNRKSNAFSRWW